MVGLRNDTISPTPLEQAIKGRRKLIESCLESLISCRRKNIKMKFIVRKLDFKIKVNKQTKSN
jgi:hypothetical protein